MKSPHSPETQRATESFDLSLAQLATEAKDNDDVIKEINDFCVTLLGHRDPDMRRADGLPELTRQVYEWGNEDTERYTVETCAAVNPRTGDMLYIRSVPAHNPRIVGPVGHVITKWNMLTGKKEELACGRADYREDGVLTLTNIRSKAVADSFMPGYFNQLNEPSTDEVWIAVNWDNSGSNAQMYNGDNRPNEVYVPIEQLWAAMNQVDTAANPDQVKASYN